MDSTIKHSTRRGSSSVVFAEQIQFDCLEFLETYSDLTDSEACVSSNMLICWLSQPRLEWILMWRKGLVLRTAAPDPKLFPT